MSESVEVVRQKEIVTRMRELNSKVIAERDALAAELAERRGNPVMQSEWQKQEARIRELETALAIVTKDRDTLLKTLGSDVISVADRLSAIRRSQSETFDE